MPLDPKRRQEVIDAAKDAGVDPDEAIAEAEKIAAEDEDAPSPAGEAADAPAPKGEIRIFAYHLPFMRVNEVRESIGLKPDMEDGNMPTGAWLVKHGGTPPVTPSGGEDGS